MGHVCHCLEREASSSRRETKSTVQSSISRHPTQEYMPPFSDESDPPCDLTNLAGSYSRSSSNNSSLANSLTRYHKIQEKVRENWKRPFTERKSALPTSCSFKSCSNYQKTFKPCRGSSTSNCFSNFFETRTLACLTVICLTFLTNSSVLGAMDGCGTNSTERIVPYCNNCTVGTFNTSICGINVSIRWHNKYWMNVYQKTNYQVISVGTYWMFGVLRPEFFSHD